MAATDSPLKRLVTTFINDFAEWLLKSEVAFVTPQNIELHAHSISGAAHRHPDAFT